MFLCFLWTPSTADKECVLNGTYPDILGYSCVNEWMLVCVCVCVQVYVCGVGVWGREMGRLYHFDVNSTGNKTSYN